jgi:hypothetical protein
VLQQLKRSGKRAHLAGPPRVGLRVPPLEPRGFVRGHAVTGLSEQRVGEEPAAHPDAAMDAPHRQLDTGVLERLPPREHVLVHAVHQRAVEIEEQRRIVTNGHGITLHPRARPVRVTRHSLPSAGVPRSNRRRNDRNARLANVGIGLAPVRS